MQESQNDTSAIVDLTPVAADKVRELLAQRGTPGAGLRIGVRGGGCSGNSYFMEFCESESPGDEVVASQGITLYVDLKSAVLLGGTRIDYVEGLMGAGFKFENPNVRHSCACGESFSV
ncbi:MAG: HesB/IscA family protein [Candidatus Eisenbacteria bacterium]